MTIARKAVDSTLKKILLHAGEIIGSVILLIIICLPLVFVIPMWLQQIGFETSVPDLLVNPVAWLGIAGAIAVTMVVAIASAILGYAYVNLMTKSRGKVSEAVEEETPEAEEVPVKEPPLEEELPESSAPETESVEAADEEPELLDEESEDATDEPDEV